MMVNNEIINICRDKKVLHIGALGDYDRYLRSTIEEWDFHIIRNVAKQLIGIDIEKKGIKLLRSKGYDIRYGNAEKFKFSEKFDIIFAGDLIEHINNIGSFLESCRAHMNKNSLLIVSTPNPYSFNMLIRGLFSSADKGIYEDHTALITPKNLTLLLKRYNLKIKKIVYYTLVDRRSILNKIFSYLILLLSTYKKNYSQAYYCEIKFIK